MFPAILILLICILSVIDFISATSLQVHQSLSDFMITDCLRCQCIDTSNEIVSRMFRTALLTNSSGNFISFLIKLKMNPPNVVRENWKKWPESSRILDYILSYYGPSECEKTDIVQIEILSLAKDVYLWGVYSLLPLCRLFATLLKRKVI